MIHGTSSDDPSAGPIATKDTQTFTHTYPDSPGHTYIVAISAIADENVYQWNTELTVSGDVSWDSDPFTVQQYNPLNPGDAIVDGIADAGVFMEWPAGGSYTIDWGDGSAVESFSTDAWPPQSSGHNYTTAGDYIVTVTDTTDGTVSHGFVGAGTAPLDPADPKSEVLAPGQDLAQTVAYNSVSGDIDFATVDFTDGFGPRTVPTGGGTTDLTNVKAPTNPQGLNQSQGYTSTAVHLFNGMNATNSPNYFSVYVWSVTLGTNPNDDLLIASSDDSGLAPVVVYAPRPNGEAVDVTLTSSDPSQNLLFDTDEPGTDTVPVLGGDVTSYTFTMEPGDPPKTFYNRVLDGNTTADVLHYTESGMEDDSNSISPFPADEADHEFVSTGCEDVDSNACSDGKVTIATGARAGFTLADISDVMVGDNIDLIANLVAPPQVSTGAKFTWTVDGNVLRDWVVAPGTETYVDAQGTPPAPVTITAPDVSATKVPLAPLNAGSPATGLNQKELEFFWVTTADGLDDELDEVSVAATDASGRAIGSDTSGFQVWEPTFVTATVSTARKPSFDSNDGSVGLGLNGLHGVEFDYQVNEPGWTVGKYKSEVSPLQLYYDTSTKKLATGTVLHSIFPKQWILDAGFPPPVAGSIGGPTPTNVAMAKPIWDSPQWPGNRLLISTYADIHEAFQTYVMYNHVTPGSHWVPIGVATWEFWIHIHYVGNLSTGPFGPIGGYVRTPGWRYDVTHSDFSIVDSEPTWSKVVPLVGTYPGSGYT